MTTSLDPPTDSPADLADLYRRRRRVEWHSRTPTADLTTGGRRGRAPHPVRRESAVHTAAVNAIRAVLVSAGVVAERAADRASLTAAWEAIESSAGRASDPVGGEWAWGVTLRVIGPRVVDGRRNRSDRRVLERRPKDCKPMTRPRHQYPCHPRPTARGSVTPPWVAVGTETRALAFAARLAVR